MTERLNVPTGTPWAEKIGYSRAVRVGQQVFVSGTASVADDGTTAHIGDPYQQAKRCLEIILKALAQLGAERPGPACSKPALALGVWHIRHAWIIGLAVHVRGFGRSHHRAGVVDDDRARTRVMCCFLVCLLLRLFSADDVLGVVSVEREILLCFGFDAHSELLGLVVFFSN